MRFAPSFLEELKARLPVSEVVRRKVKLTKSGREWRGLSPFTSEKSPSFFVNDQKMAWFDFSSGKNGNIFDFLIATEGVSFPEAVERLAAEAGLALPKVTAESEAQDKRRAGLHEVLEWAARFFEAELHRDTGAKARSYLAQRGLGPDIQKRFRLGYGPAEKFALRDHLAGKGASAEIMAEAGLLVSGEDIAVPYDRFRDRVMFPICDRSGKVIAFGGRALEKDAQAKYLNSPETPLFHKGSLLYNHHNARQAAHDKGTVIAVEGYVDVIAMSVAGFPHTVAPLGTALTETQCGLLWKMAEEPILCFDGDRAGRKAAYRAIDIALPLIGQNDGLRRSLRFALLPDGQDPDDLARSGGAAAIEEVLAQALPLVDLIWLRETEAETLATPERRAGLERRLAELCGLIQDDTLRRYYAAEFRTRLASLFGQPAQQVPARLRQGNFRPPGERGFNSRFNPGNRPFAEPSYRAVAPQISAGLAQSPLFKPKSPAPSAREAVILLIFLNHPALIEIHGEALAELELAHQDTRALREKLLDLWGHHADLADPAGLAAEIERCGLGPARRRLESLKAHASLWVISPDSADEDAEAALKQAMALHRKMWALNRELKSAETALAQDGNDTNLARLRDIQEQLSALAGTEAALEGFGVASGRPTGSL